MNAPLPRSFQYDISGLIEAMGNDEVRERVRLKLTQEQWSTFSAYVQPLALAPGQLLIAQGVVDRTLYFVETGSLTVHCQDAERRIHLAAVGPGSVVGEGAFFTHQPRSATVQAGSASKVWSMTPLRFLELSKRQPEIALEIAMRLGAVSAMRLAHQRMKVLVT